MRICYTLKCRIASSHALNNRPKSLYYCHQGKIIQVRTTSEACQKAFIACARPLTHSQHRYTEQQHKQTNK